MIRIAHKQWNNAYHRTLLLLFREVIEATTRRDGASECTAGVVEVAAVKGN